MDVEKMSKKYLETTYDLGCEKIIIKSYSGGMLGDHRKRSAKTQETSAKVERHNLKKAIFNLFLLLCANFHRGDWNITLTYRRELRPDPETSKGLVAAFLKKLRTWCRKQNRTLRYIWVTHIGKRGGIHHHLILPKWIPYDVLCNFWPCGNVKPGHPLYGNNDYMGLAEYLIKGTEGEKLSYHTKGGRRYTPSKNLKRIEPRRRWISAGKWRRYPKPPKGWSIRRDSLYNGDDIWGYPYQTYRLVKIE